jgi:acylphosphatase
MKAISLELTGRVQQVGFRYYVFRVASELGVKGFVKNRPDGSVYIEAESDEEKLSAFVDHCKKGPPQSRVDRCKTTSIERKDFREFRIC